MLKKAQGSIEFIILIASIILFFILFMVAIQFNLQEKNNEKEKVIAQNIALSIQDEINLAKKSIDGYYREFGVANYILGRDYLIEIIDDRIYVKANKVALSYPIAEVNGTIKKGANIIQKQNGTIYLN